MIEYFMDGAKGAAFLMGFVGTVVLVFGVLILLFGMVSMVLQWVVRK